MQNWRRDALAPLVHSTISTLKRIAPTIYLCQHYILRLNVSTYALGTCSPRSVATLLGGAHLRERKASSCIRLHDFFAL